MLYAGAYSSEVRIYRKSQGSDAWGELPGNKRPDHPELYGYSYSHTLEPATITPKFSETIRSSPEDAKTLKTTKNLYCDVYADIDQEDRVLYIDHLGRKQVFEVEDEGTDDYISPYTGFQAGREITLTRVRHRK